MMDPSGRLTISVRKTIFTLLLLDLAFFGLDAAFYYGGLAGSEHLAVLFDITREKNVPTWFSSMLFLMTGGAAILLFAHWRAQNRWGKALPWLLIGLFFTLLSLDDTAAVHERLGHVAEELRMGGLAGTWVGDILESYRNYYWHVVVLPFFALFGLFMGGFILIEFHLSGVLFLFGGGMAFLVAAIGLDYIEGTEDLFAIMERLSMKYDQAEHLIRAVEETIEMVGVTLILASFLEHWRTRSGGESESAVTVAAAP